MKNFNGKAIYNPSGKAGEYSYWACNFYVGCSNGCEYCYCKKGILAGSMGQDKPQLKKCFRDEKHALEVFKKELKQNVEELRKHGLFFSFTTDPMLTETYMLTIRAMGHCINNHVPVKILTKCTEWMDDFFDRPKLPIDYKLIAFGFTLTGHDELEPNASTNAERIKAMEKLHDAGFKTFASIEPVIDFESSLFVIRKAAYSGCNLFKIGLESGKKYPKSDIKEFISQITTEFHYVESENREKTTYPFFYFKDSLLKAAGISRESLPDNCITRDYNIFNS